MTSLSPTIQRAEIGALSGLLIHIDFHGAIFDHKGTGFNCRVTNDMIGRSACQTMWNLILEDQGISVGTDHLAISQIDAKQIRFERGPDILIEDKVPQGPCNQGIILP